MDQFYSYALIISLLQIQFQSEKINLYPFLFSSQIKVKRDYNKPTMGKNKVIKSLISWGLTKTQTISISYQLRYPMSTKPNDKGFFDYSQPKLQKPSLLQGDRVDQLTGSALMQYEQKLKQIRQYHQLRQEQITTKYKHLLQLRVKQLHKGSTNNNQNDNLLQVDEQQQQISQQIKQLRINQLLNNQAQQRAKLQQLSSQYSRTLTQSRKQYELDYIKKYMLDNVVTQTPIKPSNTLQNLLSPNNQPSYIPNHLVLKKLYFKSPDQKLKPILLAGVQENDQNHCAYLKTLIDKLKTKNVLSMLSPDLPYFIKTENSFISQWQQFLKLPSPKVKFYLNPNPKTLNDITLTRQFIPHVLQAMTRSKSFYQTTFSMMQINESSLKYQHQPLFSGLVNGIVQNIIFCDYPWLKQRQMMAMTLNLQDLRQLLKRYAYYKQNDRENFSAELLLPKTVVQKKYRHIIKLARTIALSNQSVPILICPASIAQVMAQQWQKSPAEYLSFDYSQNSYLLDMQLSKPGQKQTLFIEFIQKLVILDIILKPLIQQYFVKFESFPYSCRNTVGGKENLSKVFLLWRHYYSLYSNAVKGNFTTIDEKQSRSV